VVAHPTPARSTSDGYEVDSFVATSDSEEEAVHDGAIALRFLRARIARSLKRRRENGIAFGRLAGARGSR
jgi:hypothetical protein